MATRGRELQMWVSVLDRENGSGWLLGFTARGEGGAIHCPRCIVSRSNPTFRPYRQPRSRPMPTRHAACSCGQLHLTIEGEPSRISMCHCLECQRRTGAVISNQARFQLDQVTFAGK